jgi:hypothetical protein
MISATQELADIVAQERYPYWLAYSTIYSGWLKIETESPEEGCRMISEGISACDARGFILGRYFYLA